LLHWRRSVPALVRGEMKFHDADEPVLALSRMLDGQEVLCVFNLGRAAQMFDAKRFGKLTPIDGHGFGSKLSGAKIDLPPFTAFFAARG
jgi:alpha-glucosidase